MKNKEKVEDNLKKEKYIEFYNKLFNASISNIEISKLPMLNYIMDKFYMEFDTPTKEIIKLREEQNKILNNLDSSLNNMQKQILDEFLEKEDEIEYNYKEKIFVMGFVLGSEIVKETNIVKGSNNDATE